MAPEEQDGDVDVEEVALAVEGEVGSREDRTGSQMEKEPEVVSHAAREGGGVLVGAFRKLEAATSHPDRAPADVKTEREGLETEREAALRRGVPAENYIDLDEDATGSEGGDSRPLGETTQD